MRPHVKSGWEEWTTGIILALETQTPFIQLLVDQEIYCESGLEQNGDSQGPAMTSCISHRNRLGLWGGVHCR